MTTQKRLFLWGIISWLFIQPLCLAGQPIKIKEIYQDEISKNWYIPRIISRNMFETESVSLGVSGLDIPLVSGGIVPTGPFDPPRVNLVFSTPLTPFLYFGVGVCQENNYVNIETATRNVETTGSLTTSKSTSTPIMKIMKTYTGIRAAAVWNVYRDVSLLGSFQYCPNEELPQLKNSLSYLYPLSRFFDLEIGLKFTWPQKKVREENSTETEYTKEDNCSVSNKKTITTTSLQETSVHFGIRLNLCS
jgi:hypothetical protein